MEYKIGDKVRVKFAHRPDNIAGTVEDVGVKRGRIAYKILFPSGRTSILFASELMKVD